MKIKRFNENVDDNSMYSKIEDSWIKNTGVKINQEEISAMKGVLEIIQADIRNKLGPIKNLIAILEHGDIKDDKIISLAKREIQQCKESIEYLSKLKK